MVTIAKDYSSDWDQRTQSGRHSKGRSLRQPGSGLSIPVSAAAAAAGPRVSMRLPTFLFFMFVTFIIARMTVRCNHACSCVKTTPQGNSLNTAKGSKCKVWVQYRSHADPVRLTPRCDLTWASVKPLIHESLGPSIDRPLIGNIILLHPVLGKVDLSTPVGGEYQSQLRKPLIAFFDDPGNLSNAMNCQLHLALFSFHWLWTETRIMIKQRTSIPVKVTSDLCFRRDQKSGQWDSYRSIFFFWRFHAGFSFVWS